jgi:hypothetical protein
VGLNCPACLACLTCLSCRMDDSEDHLVAHVLGGSSTAAMPAVPAEQEELVGLDLAALASADLPLPEHMPAAAAPGLPSPAHSAA